MLKLFTCLILSCGCLCFAQKTSQYRLIRHLGFSTDNIAGSDGGDSLGANSVLSAARGTTPGPDLGLFPKLSSASSVGSTGGGSPEQILAGVVDIHAHCDPDSVPRSIDAIDLARLARDRGMRGLVLKNHFDPTASMAYLVRKEVPGIQVFGGIVLNRTVGGINPAAVEHLVAVKGGWGRVVWMPTEDAENQVRYSKKNRPFVPVARNGELLPEVKEVLKILAQHRLVLATGHSSPAEDLMLIRAAKSAGVQNIVVTHPMSPPVKMSLDEMKQAAALGAYLEFTYSGAIAPEEPSNFHDYANAIRAVGIEHCILSSDLGQPRNPLHPDGWLTFFQELRAQGFSQQQIDQMSKVNPAKLLNLP
jgi:hypothetical protein